MKNEPGVIQKFKPALRFLMLFLGSYLVANILYGIFIESYKPSPDPLTISVSNQTSSLLALFGDDVNTVINTEAPNILIVKDGKTILRVFEGCNGINVMIVFGCFLLAFGGRPIAVGLYFLMGCLVLHLANLARVLLLFYTAIHRPLFFYYFHKYFFTAALYAVVFALWLVWIRIKITTREPAEA